MAKSENERLDMKSIDHKKISLSDLKEIYETNFIEPLRNSTQDRIRDNRSYLEKTLRDERTVYGINTGFGSLCDTRIGSSELSILQHNLVLSHASGMGDMISKDLSQLIMLLKIKNLVLGYSGVRYEIVERLITLYNLRIYPVIYELGSLGASGDLAPLAHLAIILIGQGKVWYDGDISDTASVLEKHDLEPLQLASKEGLALLNGTQFSTAYAIKGLWEAKKLMDWSNFIAATSIYGFNCQTSPFNKLLHQLRPHRGQIICAEKILEYLDDSNINERTGKAVQDPYSFRCVPQVHGATYDTIEYVTSVISTEINSVTDNPSIFTDEDEILSGGNFHAQPIALVLDFLAIALSELGSISERRIYQLTTGQKGLPTYLVDNPGLNSGIMIAQYTAASITSQNKQLCTPASVDSIVSSLGQEDHVSMAANAGTKLLRVTENVKRILAIELFSAMQALEYNKEKIKLSSLMKQVYQNYRKQISPLEYDRYLHSDLEKSKDFIDDNVI